MREFDHNAAISGEPVITRDGRPVIIAAVNYGAIVDDEKVVGWVDGELVWWRLDGLLVDTSENPLDLFMRDCEEKCCKCTCKKNVCLFDFGGQIRTIKTGW